MLIKVTTRNQIPAVKNDYSHKSTNNIYGKEKGGMGNPQHARPKEHWQQPLELTASTWQEKNSRELTLGSDIPTSQPISWENHYSKSHMHPNVHFSTTYGSRDRPREMSAERSKLNEDLVLIDSGLLFSNEKPPLRL